MGRFVHPVAVPLSVGVQVGRGEGRDCTAHFEPAAVVVEWEEPALASVGV